MVPILVLQLLMDMDDSSDDDIDYLAGSIYTDEMDSEEIETETDSMDTLPNPDSPSAESIISVSDETEDEEDALPRPESPGEEPPFPVLSPPANELARVPSPIANQPAEVPAPAAEENAAPGINTSSDEDGQTCTICFELWTNSSEHRLVSLRCGHLFGRSCITRWLKGQNARCPQCNARARKSEIRNIYAKSVKVIDSSERDKALQDLTKEIELRRRAEISATQERLKHMMAVQEAERLKKDLMEANRLLQEYRCGSKTSSSSSSQAKKSVSLFRLEKCVDISKTGGCRIVDSCDLLGMLLVSSPSSNELFQGYGFRKISNHDMKPAEFVLVHQKPIKDMAFHVHDGLVLTASVDKTLKITNVLTNSVVQTYNLDADVWSCTWDSDDPMYFYGGLRTGEVCVFDIRVTSRHVHQLPDFGAKTPVASLQYLKSPVSTRYQRKYGALVGKLSNCALQQKTDVFGEYKSVPLPSLGPFTSVSAHSSGNFLISCRPSPKQPCVSHTLCEFASACSNELICNPLQTVLGGRTQLQLTKSKLLSHPENESSLLICANDDDTHSTLVWDGSSGNRVAQLPTDSPVLDFASLKIHHSSYLTALTDKTLRLYSWTGQ